MYPCLSLLNRITVVESMTSSLTTHSVIAMNYISVSVVANLRVGYYKPTSLYICITHIWKMAKECLTNTVIQAIHSFLKSVLQNLTQYAT